MMGFILLNYRGCDAGRMTRLRTAYDNGQVIFLSVSFPELWRYATFVIINTFIRGNFSRHITAFILTIAAAQLAIGICIAGKGVLSKTALAGAIIFLLAI
ncbi:MAG TPA: hypothetical protein VGE90_13590 [Chitinophaga sp.]